MKLQEFFYDLPKELIAQHPLEERAHARLMIVDRKKKSIQHDIFAHIGRYLPVGSLIVLNDSKVIPARLIGYREKTKGKVEIFLLKRLSNGCSYQALIRPLKRLRSDEKIIFNGGSLSAQIQNFQGKIVRFNTKNLSKYLNKIGHMPLPPYIKREDTLKDRRNYQTVFASRPGSVASPTAGLHFTKDLLDDLKSQGHFFVKLTLHINYATFKPVEVEDIALHQMQEEAYAVSRNTWEKVIMAKKNGRSIVAVGTTSTRVLEALALKGVFNPNFALAKFGLKGNTDIFIYPGFSFRMVNILITNFHLPCSTLLMLTYAFGGKELIKRAYQEAINQKYRFYSYGDAMVIL